MTKTIAAGDLPPGWLPEGARLYLHHVEGGVSIRQLARTEGCHASTVLRRVRRIEERREDPLVDEVLSGLGAGGNFSGSAVNPGGEAALSAESRMKISKTQAVGPVSGASNHTPCPRQQTGTTAPEGADTEARPQPEDEGLTQEIWRVLRRLAEPGALLIVSAAGASGAPGAETAEKAVVLRAMVRTAVTTRAVAQALALRDFIALRHSGRVTSYEISLAGRAALRRVQEGAETGSEAADFAGQHRVWGTRDLSEEGERRRLRVNLAESPLGLLARRRDAEGRPFLMPDLVAAGERLREDFELAQMGPRVAQNWERFLTGGERGGYSATGRGGGGSEGARDRVAAALRDLGPGLGDMVLRCCCMLEGLETAERRLGWSARSGKIVLRIALMRLRRHYDETYGTTAPLIG